MTGKLDGLFGDTLLKTAVTEQHNDVMIENRMFCGVEMCCGHFCRHRHADAVRDALTKRTRRGFHAARRVRQLRMTGRLRAQLTEALDLVERHVAVAAQVQPRIEEHGAVAGGEHEAIAVEPPGVLRTVNERVPEQHRADFRAA